MPSVESDAVIGAADTWTLCVAAVAGATPTSAGPAIDAARQAPRVDRNSVLFVQLTRGT